MTQEKQPLAAYAKFFWPLSMMGLLIHVGRLAQNYVLLDFERGVRELALFALATAIFGPFRSLVAMIPQMTTVMGDTSAARRATLRFVTIVFAAVSVPVAVLAWTPLGIWTAQLLYGVDDAGAQTIATYLRFLSPTMLLAGWRQYCTGILVRQKRTGWFTALHTINQCTVIAMLAIGIHQSWAPINVIGMSALMPAIIGLMFSAALIFMRPVADAEGGRGAEEGRSFGELMSYFWPLAVTTVMFTLSRPIIFALVVRLNRDGDPAGVDTTAMVAALSLAFSLGGIFQATVNQFRHLMVAFGDEHRVGIQRFMKIVAAIVTALMVLALVTPAARWFLVELQGAKGHTLRMTLDALWVLCLVPVVITWRNYHHGLSMVQRTTIAMAAGSTARNGSILLVGMPLLLAGGLNHWTAAGLLVLSFTTEAAVVLLTRSRAAAVVDVSGVVT